MCSRGGEVKMLISIASLCGGTGKTTVGVNLCELLSKDTKFEGGVTFIRSNSVIKENSIYQKKVKFEYLFGDLGQMWQQCIDEKIQEKHFIIAELDGRQEWERETILKSDMVMLVMTPTVEHLQGSMDLLQFLFRHSYPVERIKVVCNRYKIKKGLESDEILAVLPIPLSKWQWLPEEPDLLVAEKKGELLANRAPKTKFITSLRRLAMEITNIEPIRRKNGSNDLFEINPNLYPVRLEAHRMLIERVIIDENEPRDHLEKRLREELANVFLELRTKGRKINLEEEKFLERKLLDDVLGLGEIEELVRDHTITEIMVNGPSQIYVERNGLLELTDHKFTNNDEVKRIIERIVSPLGRRIDESSPAVDARLPDGSRVHAIIPPLAINGPTLTIRKFSKSMLKVEDLLENESITDEMLTYLKEAVVGKKNIIVSGGTGSGKTTLLNIISGFIPEKERIVCIEDSAELSLNQTHVVRLEARPANVEGKGQVTIRDLVKHALRMRPDRIVVGEVRGAEALDMLQAMNTGHNGSLTTAHANTPEDLVLRLETMVLMSGFELPIKAIREQIAAAIDIVIQTTRQLDGARKVTCIKKIDGMKKDEIILKKVF